MSVDSAFGLAGLGLLAVSAILRPRLGLMAAFAALPLVPAARLLGPVAVSVTEMALLAAAAGAALRAGTARWRDGETAGQRDSETRASHRPAVPPSRHLAISAFLLAALLSLLVTHYPRLSLRELRLLVLEPVLAYALLRHLFPTADLVLRPLGAFLVGVVLLALGGLVGAGLGLGTSEAEGVRRLQATYLSANHLALVLERALPFLLALALLRGRWRRPLLLGATAVALALGLTFSLGGWLGAGAALLALALARGARRLALLAGTLGALGLGALLLLRPERVLAHLDPSRGTGFIRLHLWQSSLQMLADHPLLGVGLDNFLYLYQQRYILPAALAEANLSHPHNWVLHWWLSLGLLGLVAFVWLTGRALVLAIRACSPAGEAGLALPRALALGAIGSLAATLVHGSVDNSYFLPDLALLFWLSLAVVEAAASASGGRAPSLLALVGGADSAATDAVVERR